MKWKCPIKLSSHLAMAHFERPLLIQLTARDSLGNVFDNFTSLKTEWQIADKSLLEKSKMHGKIETLEVASQDDSTLIMLGENEDIANSNRLFYQRFDTKSSQGDTRITAKMYIEGTLNNLNQNIQILPFQKFIETKKSNKY